MHRKNRFGANLASKLILFLLVIGFVLLSGCSGKVPSQSSTTEPSVPVTTTQPPETTEAAPSLEIVVNEATLTYGLTEADITEFYALLSACEDLSLNGTDTAAVEESVEKLDDKYAYLEEQYTISMVLYYSNLNDEAASQLYLDTTDSVTQANNDYLLMARRVYLSESPHKDILFADWTEEDLAFLMAYTEEVMDLQQRNSEIEVDYQNLQNSTTLYEEMVPLYIELVQNNNRIAEIYGYDNYYEYAYEQAYDRDYDHEKIETMRTYVAQYLAPSLTGAMSKFNASMRGLSEKYQETLISFLYSSYVYNSKPYVASYLATLPETMQNNMLDMFNGNIVMKDNVFGAQEGAFTTALNEERQLCFFGPGYSNAMTIVHEVGHYYGGTYTYLNEIPLDLAETQSQGNEWLFLRYLEGEMSQKIYAALVDYRMYSDLAQILICVLVDEFEEQVYTHENIASLTSDDLDAIMESVCENYGGIDFVSVSATDIQSYWRMVVVEQPVYYISYAVSALAAMDLYTVACEDYDLAIEKYRMLNEEADPEKGFLGNITAAGIAGPFEEDIYKALYEKFS